MGYTIQVGAFTNVNNAARLTDSLKQRGLDAYYFVYKSEIYKVRFGNFDSDAAARKRAESLKQSGVIEEYYIVNPRDYTIAHQTDYGSDYVRRKLVETAESFLGVPYLWGGTNSDNGFDCSGLTMAVYRHNGLSLPRSSGEQFDAGIPIDRNDLKNGDLIFFKNSNGTKISHVGIFTGQDQFIHAPGRGKVICRDQLSSNFYSKRFAGGRRYFD